MESECLRISKLKGCRGRLCRLHLVCVVWSMIVVVRVGVFMVMMAMVMRLCLIVMATGEGVV